jgi:NDP-sugar pyrophosphorylase family protein
MRSIILAGGKGTRLEPYTTVLPKPLMPIGDMPILEVMIRQLKYFGFKEITLAVGHLSGLIEAFFGDGRKFGVKISYSREDKPLGTAGPLSLIDGLDDTFLIMNGDLLTNLDFGDMVRFHKRCNAVATLGLYQKRVKIDLGVIEADKKGLIKDYIEKPTMKYEISMGIYVFEPQIREYITKDKRLDLPDLIKLLRQKNETVMGYRFSGHWLDIGRYEDYQEAINLFKSQSDKFLYK